jgi:PhnB protein
MSMRIEPYLFFNGRAEEAIEFYRKALGAQVQMLMRFKDAPDQPPPDKVAPGSENKVMHASLKVGDSVLMLSDGMASGTTDFKGFSLSISVNKEADADRVFAALADGGRVEMPLGKTFWAPKFGMLVDKFGVGWMVNLEQ